MNKNATLQSILSHLAQNAALPSEIDLWPTIRARLAAGKTFSQAKEPEMKAKHSNFQPNRAVFIGALTLLLALGLIFVLPQGRAWANNILRFFIPSSDQISLPTPQPVNLVGVTPGEVQSTLTPPPVWHPAFVNSCGEWVAPRCSVTQIQEMVSFPVKAIAALPEGMKFIGATGGPEGVTLVYHRDDPYTTLMLIQGPTTPDNKQAVPVGSSAVVEEMVINGVIGEYVSGGYFQYGGDTEAKWDSSMQIQSLRWDENRILYTMTLTGSSDFTPQPLDKTGLANLAASLTDQAPLAATQPVVDQPKSVSEVEKEAGFSVVEPSWLPEGYHLERTHYLPDSKIVCLEYRHPSDQPMGSSWNLPAPSLTIAESAFKPLPDLNELVVSGLRSDQILLEKTNLRVGGALNEQGLYAYGSLSAGKICDSQSFQNKVLFFQANGKQMAIIAQGEGPMGRARNWLTQREMVRLAESITGLHYVTDDQPDPEFLTSIEDAKQLSGFPLRLPTNLPEGMNFYYARVVNDGNIQKVDFYYIGYFNKNPQIVSISQIKGAGGSLEMILESHQEAYHWITIHSQPALISQGYWNENGWKKIANGGDGGASVIWYEDGIKYSVSGFNAYPSQVWIDIAESVK